MNEMINDNFSVNAVNDTIIAAKSAYDRAMFAEILAKNTSGILLDEASSSLEGFNYDAFSYSDVIIYTDQVTKLKAEAYDVFDHLIALEFKSEEYKLESIEIEEVEILLEEAYLEFSFERYISTKEILSEANLILEENRARSTALRVVSTSGKNFFKKHWVVLSIIFIILIFLSYFSYFALRRIRLERKLKKLHSEKISIKQLLIDTQKERFEKLKLSSHIYGIRMDYYSRRLNEISSEIPVIQEILKKIEKKKIKKMTKPKITKEKSKIIKPIISFIKPLPEKKSKKQKKLKKKSPKLKKLKKKTSNKKTKRK